MNQKIYDFIISRKETDPKVIRRNMLHEIGIAAPLSEIKTVLDIRKDCKAESFVSRSVYQKLAEENKKLLRDLRTICLGDPADSIMTRIHWRKRFRKEDKFWKDIQEVLKQQLKKDSSSINQKSN